MTNVSESFNSVLKGARNMPTTTFVWMTFYRMDDYFVFRRKVAPASLVQDSYVQHNISSISI